MPVTFVEAKNLEELEEAVDEAEEEIERARGVLVSAVAVPATDAKGAVKRIICSLTYQMEEDEE